MRAFCMLVKRNVKIFFKDKGMFFTSLITPIILLVLYSTFLANVYKDNFANFIPTGFLAQDAANKLINGAVAGELFSSLLAVCCVTVAFCSNTLMATDKLNGARKDMMVTPVKKSTVALAYYVATMISTIIVTYVATGVSFIYIALKNGWFLSFGDVMLILLDVFVLTAFGTAFSCLINNFLTTQGQVSAIGTIISAGYGFVSGAYMPISSFGTTLQRVMSFLPSTYGTSLIRNHALNGVFREMAAQNFPPEAIEKIKDSIDCNIYFFDVKVSVTVMYIVVIASLAALLAAYLLVNLIKIKIKRKPAKTNG